MTNCLILFARKVGEVGMTESQTVVLMFCITIIIVSIIKAIWWD